MKTLVLAFVCTLAAISAAAAGEPSVADQKGVWVCLPDDPAAPQVYVDFEENVYRRCDPNICSSYEILNIRRRSHINYIWFTPDAQMQVDDAGNRYTETMAFGASVVTSTGECKFRGAESEPDRFEREELRRNG